MLFEDETDLLLCPPLRCGWTKKGKPADVEITGVNAKRVVFGTLSLTGHRLLMVRRKQRAIDFQEFLRMVHEHYRNRPVLMILDGDSSHTAGGSQALAEQLGIELEWLPVRSPRLNAIEDLWGKAKDVVCANHQYLSIELQARAFVNYIQNHSNHQAKRETGLLKDDFWLFQ